MASGLISIYRPDVFERFRDGEAASSGFVAADVWFRTSIATQYQLIARAFGCEVQLSVNRVEEARRLWFRDTGRIEMERGESLRPDGIREDGIPNHFKQIGFLVYWLRRRCVLQNARRGGSGAMTVQDKFLLSANEICAFLFGLRLCHYFEFEPLIEEENDIVAAIRRVNLETHYLHDAATLLRHKNISPHALYLIFRSLFYRLDLV